MYLLEISSNFAATLGRRPLRSSTLTVKKSVIYAVSGKSNGIILATMSVVLMDMNIAIESSTISSSKRGLSIAFT